VVLWLTVPITLYKFHRYCKYRFQVGIQSLPLELAERAPRASVDSWVYVPPPLQEQSLGWYPEWMKAWDGWGMPAYSM
jgi:hypothetical protein